MYKKKEEPKSFPVCTIRSYLSQPVHAIVWAKNLFSLLFGPVDDGHILKDLKEMTGNITDPYFGEKVFEEILYKEVKSQIDMGKFTGKPKIPRPLNLEKALSGEVIMDSTQHRDHRVLTIRENAEDFLATIKELALLEGPLTFDKDFEASMKFVSCAANLRMWQFNMDMQSSFKNKGIAGNIVHAIATTNAIVSAAMIGEAIKILKKDYDRLCCGFIVGEGTRLWTGPMTSEPNPDCAICQKSIKFLSLDYNRWDLGDFVDKILKKYCNFIQPDMTFKGECIPYGNNCIEYEDIAGEDMHDLALSDGRIGCDPKFNVTLMVDGFLQEGVTMHLLLRHVENIDDEEYPDGFVFEDVFSAVEDLQKKEVEKNENVTPAKRNLENAKESASKKLKAAEN